MYNRIIENYIKKLDTKKIIEYGAANNIYLKECESEEILKIIKKDWKILLYGNPTNTFNDLKEKINCESYEKIVDLYYKMKEKYQM